MRRILLATTNPAKLARLRWLLDGLPLLPITPATLPGAVPQIAEDGADFIANASAKALGWSALAGEMLVLASDGGLEIPALGERWSALRTRRNAGETADSHARIKHLLHLMADLRGGQRQAFWHEALTLARDGVLLRSWSAEGDGGLIVERHTPSGADDHFWTESIRYYPATGKLYRDLAPADLEALDGVWPRLRKAVAGDLLELLRHLGGA